MNKLYFGDCLDVLKKLYKEFPKGFIDLIYIDPPFNSKRNYNILFESIDLKDTKAQKEAFSDTWSNVSYQDTINEIQELELDLFKFLTALDDIYLSKSAISYLTTMSIRIWYMHKVMQEAGSFYLHCDPTMSHYLKIICDLIFGQNNFRNEIIWHYKKWSIKQKQFVRNHDIILFYSKSNLKERAFNQLFMERANSTKKRFGTKKIISGYDKGGKRLPSQMESMESEGVSMDDVWNIGRVPPIKQLFPTQKPIDLLNRIITASSNEGDLIADFFCGCGTTIASAHQLKRDWLGVDISHLSIQLILKRLTDPFPEDKRKEILSNIDISGLPKDIASAHELAIRTDKHRIKFQDWVIEVLIGGVSSPKKSADGGCDGYFTFPKSSDGKQKGTGVIEVKSGNVSIGMIRSFMSSVEAFKADLGVFVCFKTQITNGMRIEAKAKGYISGFKVDKIQILSVDELMDGIKPRTPGMAEFSHFEKSIDRIEQTEEEKNMFD